MKNTLIIVDMQNDFVRKSGALPVPGAEEIVPRICEMIRSGYYENIVLTRDTHNENYLRTQEGVNLPVKHCLYKSEGWQIISEIEKAISDAKNAGANIAPIINKRTFGTFEWKDRIDSRDLGTLTVAGICSDICLMSAVVILKATFPEVPLTVYSNTVKGLTEEKNKAALQIFDSLQVKVEEW